MQEQYIFVYNALLEALKVGDTVISCVDFCTEYERLCHIDPTKGKSGLLEQFEVSPVMFVLLHRIFVPYCICLQSASGIHTLFLVF